MIRAHQPTGISQLNAGHGYDISGSQGMNDTTPYAALLGTMSMDMAGMVEILKAPAVLVLFKSSIPMHAKIGSPV